MERKLHAETIYTPKSECGGVGEEGGDPQRRNKKEING